MVERIKFQELPAASNPAATQVVVFEGNSARRADQAFFRGHTGWSPTFSLTMVDNRAVLQVVGWIGGTGTAPATGQWLGETGLVSSAAQAVDIRGPFAPAPIPFVPNSTSAIRFLNYLYDGGVWLAKNNTNLPPATGTDWERLGDYGLTHTHTKSQVGLGNVDNTSDANKPVSNAVQTALDLKADQSALVSTNNRVTTLEVVPNQAEAQAGTDNTKRMTALRTAQAIDSLSGAEQTLNVTTDMTAVRNKRYRFIGAASRTVSLPSSPSLGETLGFCDGETTVNHTIFRNGRTIMGLSENLVLDRRGYDFTLWWNGSDWRLF